MEQHNREVRIHNVRPSTIAAFEASFGAILGLVIAFMAWIGTTVQYTQATDSLLSGLLMGMTAGVLTLMILPLIYAAIGWVVGYVQALIFNLVIATSGGIALSVADEMPDAESMEAAPTNPMPAGQRDQPAFGESIGPRKKL